MSQQCDDSHYLLLTPGPLSTSDSVKASMMQDWCTWDDDYNNLVQSVRRDLVRLASHRSPENFTAVLMQGSGTASVEATLGSAIAKDGKLLLLNNGAYGKRMGDIARYLDIDCIELSHSELDPVDLDNLERALSEDPSISHVAVVHCETTTGRLNDIDAISAIVKRHEKVFIVDAMSSFGGMAMDMESQSIDFLISSANKCIQGVPGFGFVLARTEIMSTLKGNSRSLSLDLYDQWHTMETQNGKWRFTSPTHVVRAFRQALDELFEETLGGRSQRYETNQRILSEGMTALGFRTMISGSDQSSFITSFHFPDHPDFTFRGFYESLKSQGFVIYPGKVSNADCFRIGTIGEIFPADIERLISAVRNTQKTLLCA